MNYFLPKDLNASLSDPYRGIPGMTLIFGQSGGAAAPGSVVQDSYVDESGSVVESGTQINPVETPPPTPIPDIYSGFDEKPLVEASEVRYDDYTSESKPEPTDPLSRFDFAEKNAETIEKRIEDPIIDKDAFKEYLNTKSTDAKIRSFLPLAEGLSMPGKVLTDPSFARNVIEIVDPITAPVFVATDAVNSATGGVVDIPFSHELNPTDVVELGSAVAVTTSTIGKTEEQLAKEAMVEKQASEEATKAMEEFEESKTFTDTVRTAPKAITANKFQNVRTKVKEIKNMDIVKQGLRTKAIGELAEKGVEILKENKDTSGNKVSRTLLDSARAVQNVVPKPDLSKIPEISKSKSTVNNPTISNDAWSNLIPEKTKSSLPFKIISTDEQWKNNLEPVKAGTIVPKVEFKEKENVKTTPIVHFNYQGPGSSRQRVIYDYLGNIIEKDCKLLKGKEKKRCEFNKKRHFDKK